MYLKNVSNIFWQRENRLKKVREFGSGKFFSGKLRSQTLKIFGRGGDRVVEIRMEKRFFLFERYLILEKF